MCAQIPTDRVVKGMSGLEHLSGAIKLGPGLAPLFLATSYVRL